MLLSLCRWIDVLIQTKSDNINSILLYIQL